MFKAYFLSKSERRVRKKSPENLIKLPVTNHNFSEMLQEKHNLAWLNTLQELKEEILEREAKKRN